MDAITRSLLGADSTILQGMARSITVQLDQLSDADHADTVLEDLGAAVLHTKRLLRLLEERHSEWERRL